MQVLLGTVVTTLAGLLMKLLAEPFLKKAIIIGLEHLVKMTETEADDQLLTAAKEAWGEKPVAPAEPKTKDEQEL